jgi:hypothetical protein
MDSLGGGIANADLSKLSDRDKQELQQFAMNEGQKARIQSCMFWFLFLFTSHHPGVTFVFHHVSQPRLPFLFYTYFPDQARTTCNNQLTCCVTDIAIHSLTDTCFRKCIPAGTVKNGKLDKYEEPCMRQCVDRFLDANMVVLRELERLRG